MVNIILKWEIKVNWNGYCALLCPLTEHFGLVWLPMWFEENLFWLPAVAVLVCGWWYCSDVSIFNSCCKSVTKILSKTAEFASLVACGDRKQRKLRQEWAKIQINKTGRRKKINVQQPTIPNLRKETCCPSVPHLNHSCTWNAKPRFENCALEVLTVSVLKTTTIQNHHKAHMDVRHSSVGHSQ